MKTLLMGTTLAVAALAGTPLLADPGHQHGRPAATADANNPAATTGQHRHGQHQMGHGMRGRHGAQGHAARQGAGHGNHGDGCPMHNKHA